MDEGLGRNGRVTPGVSRREISWRPDSGRALPRISPLPVWADALVLLALATYLLIGLSGPALSRQEAVQIGLTQDAGVLITHPAGLLPGAANSPAQDSARLAYGSLARYAAATGWYLVAGRDAPRPIDLAQLDPSSPSSPSSRSGSSSPSTPSTPSTPSSRSSRSGSADGAVVRPVTVHPIERSHLLAARALPALFAALSILMLFLVARRLLGRPAATVAVVVFALQPAVMDAGRTVSDAGPTLLFGLGAVYVAAGIGAALATGREATLSAWTAAGLWSGLCLAAGLDAFPLVAGAAGFCLAGLLAGQVARQRLLMAGRAATGGTLGQNVASFLVTALVAVVAWVLVSPSLWGWLPDRLAARRDDRAWLIARGLLADPGPGGWAGRLQALPHLARGPAGALLLYLVAAGGAVLLVLAARSVRAMNLSRRGAVALLIWAGVTLLWFVSWPSMQPAHTIPLLAVASLLAASLVSWAQNSRLVIRGTDQARDDRG